MQQVHNSVVKEELCFYFAICFCKVKLNNILVQTICPETLMHFTQLYSTILYCWIILCRTPGGSVNIQRSIGMALDSIANRFLIEVLPHQHVLPCALYFQIFFPWCMHLCHHAISLMVMDCTHVLRRQNQNVSLSPWVIVFIWMKPNVSPVVWLVRKC